MVMGALWAPVYLPLCDSPVLGLAVAVQEGFQSPRHYFTFNLIPPLYSLTFENRSIQASLSAPQGLGNGQQKLHCPPVRWEQTPQQPFRGLPPLGLGGS